MGASIDVTRSIPIPNPYLKSGYVFTVYADNPSSPSGPSGPSLPSWPILDSNIFRMTLLPFIPEMEIDGIYFSGVCTIFDMINLPINNPIPPGVEFRVSSSNVYYSDVIMGDTAWNQILIDVNTLLDNINAASTIDETDTVILTG